MVYSHFSLLLISIVYYLKAMYQLHSDKCIVMVNQGYFNGDICIRRNPQCTYLLLQYFFKVIFAECSK